ncbi:hypothetical protein KAR91_40350 [Candidatus Pacearchaeota archaeon]|nr:hypothetical protein [Candidatus Pacearchaeota archaeon]
MTDRRWPVGQVLARMDMVLGIDAVEPDTGEYFVKVAIWSDETDCYEEIKHTDPSWRAIAAISGDDIDKFFSGVNPKAVDILIERFGDDYV